MPNPPRTRFQNQTPSLNDAIPQASSPSQTAQLHNQPQVHDLEKAIEEASQKHLINRPKDIRTIGQATDSNQPNQAENPHRHTISGIINVFIFIILIVLVAYLTYYLAPDF